MAIQIVHYSDCGPVRAENQDAYCAFSADTPLGPASLVAVCDGMGGLSSGEIASATVIHAFAGWFQQTLPALLRDGDLRDEEVFASWNETLQGCHVRLRQAAEARQLRWGTTLSMILLTPGRFRLFHVGDSRIYLDDGRAARQMTKDQTLAMRELEAGNLSPQDYPADPRRNVLLQCIGDRSISPFFQVGGLPPGGAVLACSDGFYHTADPDRLHQLLAGPKDRARLQQDLWQLAARARQLGETDNLTAVILRWEPRAAARRATLPLQPPDPGAPGGGMECVAKVVCAHASPL